MKIGYYVQGAADEAFVHGLARRWCPKAQLAPGRFRGSSRESHRREMPKALMDLRDHHHCDMLIILTDSDTGDWREIKQREWQRVPQNCQHMSIYGVAERNIECWLSIDRQLLAEELECDTNSIPTPDPSGYVKRAFGLGHRGGAREEAKERIQEFIVNLSRLRSWIEGSTSFEDFYRDVRNLSSQRGCEMPNELDAA